MIDDPAPETDAPLTSSTRSWRWATSFFRNCRVLVAATVDKRVPGRARLAAVAMPAAFYVAPIDPIPNHLPILGHADDVIVALLAIALFVRLTPAAVRDRLRAGVQPLSADQVVTATLTVLGVTVVAAVTLAWSGFLLWGTIYLFRP